MRGAPKQRVRGPSDGSAAKSPQRATYRPQNRSKPPNPDRTTFRPKNLGSPPAGAVSVRVNEAGNAVGTTSTYSAARVTQIGPNSQLVTHREFITNVSLVRASGVANNFSVLTLGTYKTAIQPGLASMFAYLSQLATLYDRYRFRKLVFIYEPCIPTTKAGLVAMAALRDAADANVTSLGEATNLPGAVQVNIWRPAQFVFACDNIVRYVRTGALAANLDIKTYDAGVFQFMLANQPAESFTGVETYGTLSAEYEVELIAPHFSRALLAKATSLRYSSTGASRASPFGTLNAGTFEGSLQANIGTTTFALPAGSYLVTIKAQGTTMTNTGPTLTASGAATVGAAVFATQYIWSTTNSAYMFLCTFANFNGDAITVDYTAACATLTATEVYVSAFSLT